MVKFTDLEREAYLLAMAGEAINSDFMRVITHKIKIWIKEADANPQGSTA